VIETEVLEQSLGGFVRFGHDQPGFGAEHPGSKVHELREGEPCGGTMQAGQAGPCALPGEGSGNRRATGERG
jgi:hypothetical protein